MRRNLNILGIALVGILFLQSCAADLRTRTVKKGDSQELELKGKALLDEAWKAQGMDKLRNHKTYSFTASDDWKGLMGTMGQMWPSMHQEMEMKYAVNTFDGTTTFKNGKWEGKTVGQQSWKYYFDNESGGITHSPKAKRIKPHSFGLAAFQYFTELTDRLRDASIIRYAGEKEYKGTNYDLVFVTWEEEKPSMKYDHYILYINKETKLIDHCTYTLRDMYMKMPGYQMMYGTISYTDIRDIEGIKIPFKQTIFFMGPKKEKRYLHQLLISEFAFDDVDEQELYPLKDIQKIGDNKH